MVMVFIALQTKNISKMKNENLTPEQIEQGIKLITEFRDAAQWNLDKVNGTLAKYPKGTELHVVILNIAYTIGLNDETKFLELKSTIEPVGYDFEIAKQIKRAFKGKDGNGRTIETKEITLRNIRNYLNEKRIELESQIAKWQDKINEYSN